MNRAGLKQRDNQVYVYYNRQSIVLCLVLLCFGITLLCRVPDAFGGAGDFSIDMQIIKKIESSGNPKAFNKITQARGLYQITPIVVEDYMIYGYAKNAYCLDYQIKIKNLDDLFNPIINYQIAYWYLNKRIPQMLKSYGLPVTLENILWSYNAGISNVRKNILPKETKDFITRYKEGL